MLKDSLTAQIAKATNSSGVYHFIDENNEILYIGKAKNLKKRLTSYTKNDQLSSRISRMTFLARKIEIITTNSDLEAILLEHNLIKKHRPKFNILLKDDKSFSSIAIDKTHDFGAIFKYRGAKNKKHHQFGPFASALDVKRVIDVLRKSFLLRNCSDLEFSRRKKPCLEYQIKKCSAPCVGLISKANYQKSIDDAIEFLSSKSSKIQNNLATKMQQYSQDFEYEKAALIRDKIKSLSSIQASQAINSSEIDNADIFVFLQKDNQILIQVSFYRSAKNYGSKPYFFKDENPQAPNDFLQQFLGQFYQENTAPKLILTNIEIAQNNLMEEFLSELSGQKISIKTPKQGEKLNLINEQTKNATKSLDEKITKNLSDKKLLHELKETFDLGKIPQRIEVYDNSHTSTQNAVGAMIVAGLDGFNKNQYRKFNIRFEQQNRDDTYMMREVLSRRFKNYNATKNNENNFPDLVIIDGGLGQLSAAKEIFDQLKIDIFLICMAKGEHRNAGEETYYKLDKSITEIKKGSSLAFYLQNLRDEAHRFAITTHRAKRAKTMTKSILDEARGIGTKRKKALLNHFGSIDKIKSASVKDLTRVEGISKKIAEKIWQELN